MNDTKEKPVISRGFLWLVVFLLIFGAVLVNLVVNLSNGLHYRSAANACPNNLRQIAAAADEFALENHLTNGAPINFPNDLTPYIKLNSAGKIPECPAGGIYTIKRIGDIPTCSLGTTVIPAHVLE